MMELNAYTQFDYQVRQGQMRPLAERIFDRLRSETRFGWLKALITSKMRMPSLAGRALCGQHALGLRSVAIDRIVGTESRADDFDANFNPRHERMRRRWVRIAELRLNQVTLPAVELIQLGNEYFVRDGHHRVSVARGLGNAFIDAQVTLVEAAASGKVDKRDDRAALRYAAGKSGAEID